MTNENEAKRGVKFTPGDWTFRYWSFPPTPIEGSTRVLPGVRALFNDGSVTVMGDDGPVARVCLRAGAKRGKHHEVDDAERDANARLIVESKNLFAMVQRLLPYARTVYGLSAGKVFAESSSAIQDAESLLSRITKATSVADDPSKDRPESVQP